MKGDFSDVRRWPSKRYTSVRMQQGRVQLDSDWNEAVEIADQRGRTAATDVIGQAGAPKGEPGFQITAAAGNTDLSISKGRFYVDGILCELDGATTYATQPDLPRPAFVNGWGTNAAQLALPDGLYLAYLDAWERHVTALDDEALREPALGGADTTTRTKLIQQVKLLAVTAPAGTPTCETVFPEWTALVTPAPAPGRLAARTDKGSSTPGPCSVEAHAGYSGLENQLYRVEIHKGGAPGAATFKWSRENGAIAALVTGQTGDDLTITPVPGVVLAKGDWVEVIDDGRELRGEPGVLVRLKDVQGAKLTLDPATQDPPSPAIKLSDNIGRTKVRRWEVSSPSATTAQTVIAGGPTWRPLEQRVQISLEDNRSWSTGAWWVVPARVAIGDVLWPVDGAGTPKLAAPFGIAHHYARLALVQKSGATLTVTPCAKKFPPLTAITASDVSFDDTLCKSGAKTVQQAIDHLCQRDRACCEINVSPVEGWDAELMEQLVRVSNASICFRPGRYELREPLVIDGKRSIKITGAGAGTEIIAPARETVFAFSGCAAVVVRDLSVVGGTVERRRSDPRPRLNGALDFRGCADVLVEAVEVRSDSSAERHATCISARASSVRVRACRVLPGINQVGVLVIDAPRAVIEDNVITSIPTERATTHVLRNPRLRAGFRSALVSHLAFGDTPATSVRGRRRAHAEGEARAVIPHAEAAVGRAMARSDARVIPHAEAAVGRAMARSDAPEETEETEEVAKAKAKAERAKKVAKVAKARAERAKAEKAETEAEKAEAEKAGGAHAVSEAGVVHLQVGGRDVAFRSDLPKTTWTEVLRAMPLAGDRVESEIRDHLYLVADAILESEGRSVAGLSVPGVAGWFADLTDDDQLDTASQGIVIGGKSAPDVRIRGNTITAVRQAVHVGVSHNDPSPARVPDRAGRVVIADNLIQVTVLPAIRGARHGIFVGNADSVLIEDNRISGERPSRFGTRRLLEGIRIYGFVGRHAVVQQNHISGCTTGIFFNAVNNQGDGKSSIWRVIDNMAESASTVVDSGVTTYLAMSGNKG